MKSSAALSLLLLLPSIHAVALPQGPNSNPGEFAGVDLSRANPANRPVSFAPYSSSPGIPSPSSGPSSSYSSTSSSSSSGTSSEEEIITNGGSYDQPPSSEMMMPEMAHHENHNSSRHHKGNSTRHAHRQEGILTEFNAHDEHIVVYNGTHFPNGTNYNPANTTANGGPLLGEVVVAGDEIAVYRQPWNETRHHHHYHHPNQTTYFNGTATTGIWLPSGTAWIPSSTGTGAPSLHHPHRKVPDPESAGFRGPKAEKKKEGSFVVIDEYFSKLVKFRK